jgi:hypothetical protein
MVLEDIQYNKNITMIPATDADFESALSGSLKTIVTYFTYLFLSFKMTSSPIFFPKLSIPKV